MIRTTCVFAPFSYIRKAAVFAGAVLFPEPLDAAFGVDDLLRPGEERMA